MSYKIKSEDIADFIICVRNLDKIIEKIRKYNSLAYIYATPSQLNLMSEYKEETRAGRVDTEPVVASIHVTSLDCGDW